MIENHTQEWYTKRARIVTGSVAGAILGHSPYMTRAQVMAEMVAAWRGEHIKRKTGAPLAYGQGMEPHAITAYRIKYGATVTYPGLLVVDDWIGATVDGIANDNTVLEVKCPYGARNTGKLKPLSDYPHYYDQIQVELYVTGLRRAHFWQWTKDTDSLEVVDASTQWCLESLPKLREFYEEYLACR